MKEIMKEKPTMVKHKSSASVEGLHQLSVCDMSSSIARRIEHDIMAFSARMDERMKALIRPVVARSPKMRQPTDEDFSRWEEIRHLDQEKNSVLRAMYARLYEVTHPQSLLIHNLIVNVGLGQLATWIANGFSVSTGINYGAIGTGTNTPALTDTQLQTEVQRQAPSSYNAAATVAYFSMYYPMGTLSSQTYYEYGWFINGTATANSGELFSHFLLGPSGIIVSGTTALVVESNFTFANP